MKKSYYVVFNIYLHYTNPSTNPIIGVNYITCSILIYKEETLKLKIASRKGQHGKKQVFTKNFNIIPEEIKQDNKTISPLVHTRTIKISKNPQSLLPILSSTPKKTRYSAEIFHEQHGQAMDIDESDISTCFEELSLEEEDVKCVKAEDVQTDDCIVLKLICQMNWLKVLSKCFKRY